ncbi:MAG: ATP-binding protein [Chloroflexi bacterium]|nr:ATP-binding protein [Chloroflexota bacterium]
MLDTLLNSANTPVLMIDEAGLITFFNQSLAEYFNVATMQVGMPLTNSIVHPDFLRIIVNKEPHGEIHLPEFERYLNVELSHVPGMGTIVVMTDITHLKALDKMKSNIASEISRNLRSPLTAIIGYAELLGRMGELNAQQENFVEKMMLSVNAMTQLINDLMELESVEKNTDTSRQDVDLGLIIRYSVDGLYHAIEAKHHELIMDVEKCPPIKGNPIRLRQMVNNLLQNAVQYTPDSGHITISLHSQDSEAVVLSIADDGVGIPAEDQPHIFDKFYRSHSVMTLGARSGLGLAIVQNIVAQHGGRIWFESKRGAGTKFSVVLPYDRK